MVQQTCAPQAQAHKVGLRLKDNREALMEYEKSIFNLEHSMLTEGSFH